jgi:hypothetical protein
MPATFATYTEASLNAYKFNPKSQEVLERKKEILTSIAQHHGSSPASVLFYGFSPLMLIATSKMISVTDITDEIKKFLDSTGVKYVYIKEAELKEYKKQFDWVIASDEYFTFAVTEQAQLDKVQTVAELAKNIIVTTLRDYKNQDFRDREFSQPLAVRNSRDSKIF